MEKKAGWVRRGSAIALTIIAMAAAGCGGGGGGGGAASASTPTAAGTNSPSTSSGSSTSTNAAPTIAATPSTQAAVGSAYAVAPTVTDANGDTLAFSVQNRPSWATFNTATGQLTGTPRVQDVGTYADVLISVSDGVATTSLPAFTITVAAAGSPPVVVVDASTLQWEAPTLTAAGTPLSGLVGYRIHYGKSANVLDSTIIISNAGTVAYSVANLPAGTYYFAVKAIDGQGGESDLSNVQRLTVS